MRIISLDRSFCKYPRATLVFGMFHLIFYSYAQPGKIDSMLQVLQTQPHDTIIINTQCNLSLAYVKAKDFEKAEAFAEKALSESRNLGFERGILRSYHVQGWCYNSQRRYDEAFRLYEEMYLKAIKISNDFYAFTGLMNMGHNQYSLGDQNRATGYYAKALEHATKRDHKKDMKTAHVSLGNSYLMEGNPQMAVEHHQAAVDLSIKDPDSPEKAMAYSSLSMSQGYLGDFENAVNNGLEAIRILEPFGASRDLSISYNRTGNLYARIGEYLEAKNYFTISLNIANEIGDKQLIGSNLNNLGGVLDELGQFSDALQYYFKALRHHEEIGNKAGMAPVLGNISLIHAHQGNHQQALEFSLKQLEITREVGNKVNLPQVLKGVGEYYMDLGQFDQAKVYLFEALKVAEEQASIHELVNINRSIADLYLFLSDNDEALNYLFKALTLSEELQFDLGKARTEQVIGRTYMYLHDHAAAKVCLLSSLDFFISEELKGDIGYNYLTLYQLDSQHGYWESAYNYLGLYIDQQDSLYKNESIRKLIQLQAQYDFDHKEDSLQFQQQLINEQLKNQTLIARKNAQYISLRNQDLLLVRKDRELQELNLAKTGAELNATVLNSLRTQDQLALLTNEAKLQKLETGRQRAMKNVLIGSMAALFGLVMFGYSNYISRQKLKLLKLRNKIASDLHDDVGSTLSSISIFSEIARQQSKEIIPSLETISESSRKMLDAMADIVWTIHPDNDNFEKILDRMRSFAYDLLGENKIDFEFEADALLNERKLPMEVRKNLYLIFKEATQNLVRYADADKAQFLLKEENKNLTMVIRDNGKGFDQATHSSGKGILTMKKRAEEIGGHLKIVSKKDEGTVVTLQVAV